MLTVTPIAAFTDNYIWVLAKPGDSRVIVVDPGDAEVVEQALAANQQTLAAVLITHHHQDHTGGVAQLCRSGDIPVYGPANSPFTGITQPLQDGDQITLLGQTFSITATPGHTLDHICYFAQDDNKAAPPQLFCGDTLFLAGCGRLFEGSAAQMLAAMQFFQQLPASTLVYCTHEYSLANLRFAAQVEPANPAIQQVWQHCQHLRDQQQPTLPSTLTQELAINPFMRTATATVKAAAQAHAGRALADQVAVFSVLREWKNNA